MDINIRKKSFYRKLFVLERLLTVTKHMENSSASYIERHTFATMFWVLSMS